MPSPPTLVIGQLDESHERIAKLLTDLRSTYEEQKEQIDNQAKLAPPKLRLQLYTMPVDDKGESKIKPEEMVSLIQKAIEPAKWNEEGVFIEIFGKGFVVKHNERMHRQIQQLFQQLGIQNWGGWGTAGKTGFF